jgi:hypothetical protein
MQQQQQPHWFPTQKAGLLRVHAFLMMWAAWLGHDSWWCAGGICIRSTR